jgi:hypothetical protein
MSNKSTTYTRTEYALRSNQLWKKKLDISIQAVLLEIRCQHGIAITSSVLDVS